MRLEPESFVMMRVGVGDAHVAYKGKERRTPEGTGERESGRFTKKLAMDSETLVRRTTIGKRERQ